MSDEIINMARKAADIATKRAYPLDKFHGECAKYVHDALE